MLEDIYKNIVKQAGPNSTKTLAVSVKTNFARKLARPPSPKGIVNGTITPKFQNVVPPTPTMQVSKQMLPTPGGAV